MMAKFNVLLEQLSEPEIFLTQPEKVLYSEERVCLLFGVTSRTMRRYRARHLLSYVKLGGRIFYILPTLFLDMFGEALNSRKDQPASGL